MAGHENAVLAPTIAEWTRARWRGFEGGTLARTANQRAERRDGDVRADGESCSVGDRVARAAYFHGIEAGVAGGKAAEREGTVGLAGDLDSVLPPNERERTITRRDGAKGSRLAGATR